MSRPLRHAELFAGAGGMALGLHRAGLETAWVAEWADFPRRVLAHRFPTVPLYGDVSQLDGRALVAAHGPIDLLAGGSPCQDLSVAGKRQGLEGARSGLFYEQMRLWDETQADLCLWENVDGARSSNDGKDFAQVLGAFVGATFAVPADGWSSAGVVAGPAGVAAWRVLDAQHFGVPQRRRRVFVLGTRAGGLDPCAVLLVGHGLCGDSAARGAAGEDAAAGVGDSLAFALRGRDDGAVPEVSRGVVNALRGASGGSSRDMVLDTSSQRVRNPLGAHHGRHDLDHDTYVVAFHPTQDPISGSDVTPCLGVTSGGMGVLAFSPLQGGRSMPVTREAPTLEAGTGNKAPAILTAHAVPRRLTPVECERLMSWPDGWTAVPDPVTGKPAADSLRYKACGNGVVANVAEWIGEGVVREYEPEQEMGNAA
jgi:DNA (cytosine-5)-methyltransferase 1